MKLVELKNGTVEPRPYVTAAMLSLRKLYLKFPDLFYLVVKKYRTPDYRLLPETQSALIWRGLLNRDGGLNSCVRNVIFSATAGDFPDVILHGPLEDDSSAMNKFFREKSEGS
jgi:hypothetical protein